MRLENFSVRKIALVIPVIALFNWGVLQFVLVPQMSDEDRRNLYPSWLATPWPYVFGVVLMGFALWFVLLYRGRMAAQGLKIAVFALATAVFCGLAVILVIRMTWNV